MDPEKSIFWVQSDVVELQDLTWVLSNFTPMGLLERCHSYKDKVTKGIAANHRLFACPVLMVGGGAGGWSLYATDGRLKYCYNWLGIQRYYAESGSALPVGQHQLRMEFAYDGGGLGRGGVVTLYLDGNQIGEGRVEYTQPMIFSVDETMDIGCEYGTMVAEEYATSTSKFNGKINWVQLDQGADDQDHLISPEERLHLAMSRQ